MGKYLFHSLFLPLPFFITVIFGANVLSIFAAIIIAAIWLFAGITLTIEDKTRYK